MRQLRRVATVLRAGRRGGVPRRRDHRRRFHVVHLQPGRRHIPLRLLHSQHRCDIVYVFERQLIRLMGPFVFFLLL